jgi:hypothetical protein
VDGKEIWVSPKDRVALGKFYVMTYEFDVPQISFSKNRCRGAAVEMERS